MNRIYWLAAIALLVMGACAPPSVVIVPPQNPGDVRAEPEKPRATRGDEAGSDEDSLGRAGALAVTERGGAAATMATAVIGAEHYSKQVPSDGVTGTMIEVATGAADAVATTVNRLHTATVPLLYNGTTSDMARGDTTFGQDVDVTRSALPTGASTETTVAAINTKTPALGQAAMAASVPVVVANNQSTLPISAASLPLPAGSATEASLGAIADDIAMLEIGANDTIAPSNSGVIATTTRRDTPTSGASASGATSFAISDSAGRLWVNPSDGSGDLTVDGTVAVSNAFATEASISSLLAEVQAMTFAEDVAHTTGDTGPFVLTVRADTAATTASTTGDYAGLLTDAAGKLWTASSQVENAAFTTGARGSFGLAVRKDAPGITAGENEYAPIIVDADGAQYVTDTGSRARQPITSTVLTAGDTSADVDTSVYDAQQCTEVWGEIEFLSGAATATGNFYIWAANTSTITGTGIAASDQWLPFNASALDTRSFAQSGGQCTVAVGEGNGYAAISVNSANMPELCRFRLASPPPYLMGRYDALTGGSAGDLTIRFFCRAY